MLFALCLTACARDESATTSLRSEDIEGPLASSPASIGESLADPVGLVASTPELDAVPVVASTVRPDVEPVVESTPAPFDTSVPEPVEESMPEPVEETVARLEQAEPIASPTIRDSRFGGGRLRDLADRHGLLVGIAPLQTSKVDFLSIPETELYRAILAEEFNIVTPENSQKMERLRPSPDEWRWEATDRLFEFAEGNDMRVHGHPLVWHGQVPDWVGAVAPEDRPALMRDHIERTMVRHRGRVAVWDVVNEAFEPNGGFRYSVWSPDARGDYIADAFRAARAADPAAELILNDYRISTPNAKSDELYEFARAALADGVPIDGVGMQFHVVVDTDDFDGIRRTFQRFADLGLSLWITEMDVMTDWQKDPASEAEGQAIVYENIVRLCVEQPACRAIQFWGLSDRYSWRGVVDGMPLDETFQPKPAWYAIQRALADTPATPRRR